VQGTLSKGQGQSDNAAVSYACQIGSNDQSSTNLHISKQLWQIVPVAGSAASSTPPAPPTSSPSSTPPAPPTSSPSSTPDKQGQENVYSGRKTSAVKVAPSTSGVDPKNRLTWPCQHER